MPADGVPESQRALYLGLDPIMRSTWQAHVDAYARRLPRAVPLALTSTRRSAAEQARLNPEFAVGVGQSKHEIGMAYDFHGPETDAQWNVAGELAEALGMEWGGRYHTPEPWHVEAPASRASLLTLQRATVAGGLALLAGSLFAIARGGFTNG